MNRWVAIRLGIVALAFVGTLLSQPAPPFEPPLTWFTLAIIAGVFPVAMMVGVGVLLLLRGRRLDWQTPSWKANPFSLAHSEHFFHLGVFVVLASGAANLMKVVASTGRVSPDTLAPFAIGGGVWVGLRLLTAVNRWQIHRGA